MNQFTKDIVAALANKQDLDTIFKNHLQTAINELLQNELSTYWVMSATQETALTLVIHVTDRI